MESLSSLTIPATIILSELSVPALSSYVQMTEEELGETYPPSFAHEIKKVLADRYFVHSLCKRFDLDVTDNFADFERQWLLHALFHQKNDLSVIVENYERVFRLTKALKKAAKYKRFDFVDEILNSKRLWCSFRHIRAVCLGCCWSKTKVDHYLEKFEAKHSEILSAEIEIYGEGETGTDIHSLCKYRATLKGYRDSGYETDRGVLLRQLFIHQQWDTLRERLKTLDEEERFSVLLPFDCLEYGRGAELFWNPDLVPEDLRQYFLIEEVEREDCDDVKFKMVQLLADDLKFEGEISFSYKDRVQNAYKSIWILESKFENSDPRPIVDFVSAYMDNPDLDVEMMPNFRAPIRVKGSESDDSYETEFNPTINANHVERCAEFVIWCYENKVHENEEFRPIVESNRSYIFELLLAEEAFGETDVYADWYDPLSLQYFCDHHLEAFAESVGGPGNLKERLLSIVEGDVLMEEYVRALPLQ